MLWKTYTPSANETQLDLQTESQTALLYIIHSNGFVTLRDTRIQSALKNARNWKWRLQVGKFIVKDINKINTRGMRKIIEWRR
jgi:hypothetical protein